MKIKDWLSQATHKLSEAGIASARLDALILLEDALGKDRAWLLANPDYVLLLGAIKELDKKIGRRYSFEPLSYVRGKSEFYGREFKVTPATLQPRSETETMVEMFLKNYSDVQAIIDIGTGSGAISITAKLEQPTLKVLATEINKDALDIAKQNARKLGATVIFFQGNLLEPLSALRPLPFNVFAILANLPYVPDDFTINESAMQEPKIAIFGGKDGLDLYRQLFDQISHLDAKPKLVFTESLPFQHDDLEKIALNASYGLIETSDLIQLFATAPVEQ